MCIRGNERRQPQDIWTRAEKLRVCFDVIVLLVILAGIYFGGWFLAPAP